jgi:hypothetical protein
MVDLRLIVVCLSGVVGGRKVETCVITRSLAQEDPLWSGSRRSTLDCRHLLPTLSFCELPSSLLVALELGIDNGSA